MEKEFVPFKLAVKLKELGFDETCFGMYNKDEKLFIIMPTNEKNFEYLLVPTFSQAFRWFREEHDLNPSIMYNGVGQWDYTLGGVWSGRIWDSYEEAELACLERLIDKITNKKIFDFVTDL